MNKEDALVYLDKVLGNVKALSEKEAKSLLKLGNKYETLGRKCLKLKVEIENDDNAEKPIIINEAGVEGLIYDLEMEAASLEGRAFRTLFMFGFVLFLLLFLLMWRWGGAFQDVLSELTVGDGTIKYIVLGICGAAVYFITEGMVLKVNADEESEITIRQIIAKILLAIIIPIVLVVIFFSGSPVPVEGNGTSGTVNVPLMCFAAGYSSKLVVLFLNKIVEKGEKVINAL